MNLLATEIVEGRFRGAEAILDRLLQSVREAYAPAGHQLVDRCNRSGFEKSGYPYFVWEYLVQQDDGEDPIRRMEARVAYRQPLEERDARVTVAWLAEVFNRGSLPRFRRCGELQIDLAELQARGLLPLVDEAFANASAALSQSGQA